MVVAEVSPTILIRTIRPCPASTLASDRNVRGGFATSETGPGECSGVPSWQHHYPQAETKTKQESMCVHVRPSECRRNRECGPASLTPLRWKGDASVLQHPDAKLVLSITKTHLLTECILVTGLLYWFICFKYADKCYVDLHLCYCPTPQVRGSPEYKKQNSEN